MSPDLNPIENVWSLMVHELEEELRQPARHLNQDELWAAVLAKWEELRRAAAPATSGAWWSR